VSGPDGVSDLLVSIDWMQLHWPTVYRLTYTTADWRATALLFLPLPDCLVPVLRSCPALSVSVVSCPSLAGLGSRQSQSALGRYYCKTEGCLWIGAFCESHHVVTIS